MNNLENKLYGIMVHKNHTHTLLNSRFTSYNEAKKVIENVLGPLTILENSELYKSTLEIIHIPDDD